MCQCESSPNSINEVKNKRTSIENRNSRYKKLEEAERKCLLCESGEIESEIHFLTRCPFFNERRKTFSNFASKVIQNFNNLETDKQFLALMSCENETILKKLGQFVFGSLKKRTEFLI